MSTANVPYFTLNNGVQFAGVGMGYVVLFALLRRCHVTLCTTDAGLASMEVPMELAKRCARTL